MRGRLTGRSAAWGRGHDGAAVVVGGGVVTHLARREAAQGRISTGVPFLTSFQIWSMASLVTAMHPSVQSR